MYGQSAPSVHRLDVHLALVRRKVNLKRLPLVRVEALGSHLPVLVLTVVAEDGMTPESAGRQGNVRPCRGVCDRRA